MEPLTGKALTAKVAEMGVDDLDLLHEACGYDGHTQFLEAFQEAVADQEAAMDKILSEIAIIGYRYIEYGWQLHSGFPSDELSEQQKTFEKDLERATQALKEEIGQESSTTCADLLGVMTHLFAYTISNRHPDGKQRTYEEQREIFDEVLNWANATPFITRAKEITDEGFTDEEVSEYADFRWNHWTKLGTYLRTVILDFVYGTERQNVPSFAAGLKDAKAYLAMLAENSSWTPQGIEYVVMASAKYSHACEESNHALAGFAQDLIKEWLEDGKAILTEHRK